MFLLFESSLSNVLRFSCGGRLFGLVPDLPAAVSCKRWLDGQFRQRLDLAQPPGNHLCPTGPACKSWRTAIFVAIPSLLSASARARTSSGPTPP